MRHSMGIAGGLAAAAAAAALLLTASISTSPALAAEAGCAGLPNGQRTEARRSEQSSAYLPDCRAYEQVTPAQKDSGEPRATKPGKEWQEFHSLQGALAAFDGQRIAWGSEDPGLSSGEAESLGMDYLSTRGSAGWRTEATVPPQAPETGLLCAEIPGIVGWSRNFGKGVLADGLSQEVGTASEPGKASEYFDEGPGCSHAEPALREADGAPIEEPAGFQNLFVRDSETGFYQLVNVTPSTAPHPRPTATPIPSRKAQSQLYFQPGFLAGDRELNVVAFEDELPLTVEAEHLTKGGASLVELEEACQQEPKARACWEGHDALYVWSEGQQPAVRLVTILPGGQPVDGKLAGSTTNTAYELPDEPSAYNVADYRHAVSEDGSRIFFEAEGNLYVRENPGRPQSTLGGKGECTEPAKACTFQLDRPQGGGGSGGGGWLGASGDGTKVFFTDANQLTSTAVAGSGANLYEYQLPSEAGKPGKLVDLTAGATQAEVLGISGVSEDGSYVYFVATGELVAGKGSAGEPNLYLSHEGAVTFIATLSAKDECDWTLNTGCYPRPHNNPGDAGLTARISGNGRFLAFNSTNQLTSYDTQGPRCATVVNSGGDITEYVPGSCNEIYLYEAEAGNLACASCNPNGPPTGYGAALDWPRQGTYGLSKVAYPARQVSESGQVFFETEEALLPNQDINGVRDVYEYERGSQHLISSGTSPAPSFFADASASGSDVFFATAQKLERWDTDTAYDIYDARVEGGFPEPPVSALPCESEACKGAERSSVFSTPSSTTFAGPGNIAWAKSRHKPGHKKTGNGRRKPRLRRALRKCARRYQHHRRRQRQCEHSARRRLSRKARATRNVRKRVDGHSNGGER